MISAAQNMCEFLPSAKPLTNASRSLSLTKAGTLLSSLRKSHTPPYTPKHGASLLPPCGAFSFPLTFGQRKVGGSGCTPYGVCPLPPAPQPRWAAQHSFRSAHVAFLTLGARGFLRVRGGGGITTLGVLRMLSKRLVPACHSGL